jgi:hypothetical protein
VCLTCTKEQCRNYKRKVKEKKIEIPTKFCTTCKKDIPLTGYYDNYIHPASRPCISCVRKYHEQRKYEKIMSEGGTERVSQQPNTYLDEFQKAQTFLVLERLGYVFNEDTGIWSKEGVKDKFGTWLNIIPQPKTKRRPNGVVIKKKHGVYNYINDIIRQREEEGMTYDDLAYIYCCSHTTIRMIVNNYYREKKGS